MSWPSSFGRNGKWNLRKTCSVFVRDKTLISSDTFICLTRATQKSPLSHVWRNGLVCWINVFEDQSRQLFYTDNFQPLILEFHEWNVRRLLNVSCFLTAWRIVLEKLIVSQLARKFSHPRKYKANYRVHKSQPLDYTTLSQLNPVHTLRTFIYFNSTSIVPSTPMSRKWSLSISFCDEKFIGLSPPSSCSVSNPYCQPLSQSP